LTFDRYFSRILRLPT